MDTPMPAVTLFLNILDGNYQVSINLQHSIWPWINLYFNSLDKVSLVSLIIEDFICYDSELKFRLAVNWCNTDIRVAWSK